MSNENNSDEVPAEIISPDIIETKQFEDESKHIYNMEQTFDDLPTLLELEKQKVSQFEEKLKHVLADFQNLSRKTKSDIEYGVNSKINEFMLDFIKIYDDFIRAKEVISESKINADGLNSILKNMESLMQKYNVTPIEALGEIFNPNFHEAISIISDSTLDDDTITKEIRKGYIRHNVTIRPTLVEISKKDDNKK
ncbi:MAG: nucleotide exchange factor GrpE [Candidatus Nitrosopumilus limneticus]|nr:Heat shock protein GrpE [Candidatus Nitrosopumilus limneticus]MDA0668501.1 nucleotide exchange factor GrpE [Thermoproteota archaeon]MSS85616.1 nucleotide exchange factor GrpE [Nitrosopumilus sp.]PHY04256.1 MAG: nucleotide exchange factor GrpE [Nitrososphaerota archaeon]MDA0853589.1 nucleotide exchange factor GrpE [Thermoproteota archaeon]